MIIIAFISITLFSYAQQNGTIPPIIRAQHTLDDISRGGVGTNTLLYGLPVQPGSLVGDFYLDNKWNKSSVLLYAGDKLLDGILTRFDLKSQQLEIKVDNGIKILEINRVKSLVWFDSQTNQPSYYVNAQDYIFNETKLTGLLEVMVDGQLPLLKFTAITIKKADYNVALDVGSKDDKILHKETLFFSVENNLHEIKSKKSLMSAFMDSQSKIDEFVRVNKLSYSKENDIKRIFEFYNSL